MTWLRLILYKGFDNMITTNHKQKAKLMTDNLCFQLATDPKPTIDISASIFNFQYAEIGRINATNVTPNKLHITNGNIFPSLIKTSTLHCRCQYLRHFGTIFQTLCLHSDCPSAELPIFQLPHRKQMHHLQRTLLSAKMQQRQ